MYVQDDRVVCMDKIQEKMHRRWWRMYGLVRRVDVNYQREYNRFVNYRNDYVSNLLRRSREGISPQRALDERRSA